MDNDNKSYFWAETIVMTLVKLGVRTYVISPGSRSTSLVIAISKTRGLKTFTHFDERACGFLALGISKQKREPVAVITTSGTAVAELYPSMIEAYQSRIPLVMCTADRLPRASSSGENQAINQAHLFSKHARYSINLPKPSFSKKALYYIVSSIRRAIGIAMFEDPGPIHINIPIDKPFEPSNNTDSLKKDKNNRFYKYRYDIISNCNLIKYRKNDNKQIDIKKSIQYLTSSKTGIIMCGANTFTKATLRKVVKLSETLKFPLFADAASGIRHLTDSLYTLTSPLPLLSLKKHPDLIVLIGERPVHSLALSFLLNTKSNTKILQINKVKDLKLPYNILSYVIEFKEDSYFDRIINVIKKMPGNNSPTYILEKEKEVSLYRKAFLNQEDARFEGKIINEAIKALPKKSNLFVSNSSPIRYLDLFVEKRDKNISLYSNRGASGIDGILPTSIGIALCSKHPTLLITGDIAFIYDITSLTLIAKHKINIIILLMNNNGNGIFYDLKIASYNDKIFKKYFKGNYNINYKKIIKSFDIKYYSKFKKKAFLNKQPSVFEFETDAEESKTIKNKFIKNFKYGRNIMEKNRKI